MSFGITIIGNSEELKEQIRRHAHHYWGHMPEDEKGTVETVLGHAARVAGDTECVLEASGSQSEAGRYFNLTVTLKPGFKAPEIPEATEAKGD